METQGEGNIGVESSDQTATDIQDAGRWNEYDSNYGGTDRGSADLQDNTDSDTAGSTGPEDLGSTSGDTGLTAGGTDTAYGDSDDITGGGAPRGWGGTGTTGGTSSGDLGSGVGNAIPPPNHRYDE